jgi:hypothetical protein
VDQENTQPTMLDKLQSDFEDKIIAYTKAMVVAAIWERKSQNPTGDEPEGELEYIHINCVDTAKRAEKLFSELSVLYRDAMAELLKLIIWFRREDAKVVKEETTLELSHRAYWEKEQLTILLGLSQESYTQIIGNVKDVIGTVAVWYKVTCKACGMYELMYYKDEEFVLDGFYPVSTILSKIYNGETHEKV